MGYQAELSANLTRIQDAANICHSNARLDTLIWNKGPLAAAFA